MKILNTKINSLQILPKIINSPPFLTLFPGIYSPRIIQSSPLYICLYLFRLSLYLVIYIQLLDDVD